GVSGLGAFWHCTAGMPCMTPKGPGLVKCVDIYDMANDPQLAGLVSTEGTIKMRYPQVPWEDPGGCALLATSGLGALGEDVCSKPPPVIGPTGRGADLIASALGSP